MQIFRRKAETKKNGAAEVKTWGGYSRLMVGRAGGWECDGFAVVVLAWLLTSGWEGNGAGQERSSCIMWGCERVANALRLRSAIGENDLRLQQQGYQKACLFRQAGLPRQVNMTKP